MLECVRLLARISLMVKKVFAQTNCESSNIGLVCNFTYDTKNIINKRLLFLQWKNTATMWKWIIEI